MSLPEMKQKLIAEIETSTNEEFIAELLRIAENQHAPSRLSDDQLKTLRERIQLVEEGQVTYLNAKEEIEKLRAKRNGLSS